MCQLLCFRMRSVFLLLVLGGGLSLSVLGAGQDDCGPAFKGKCSCGTREYDFSNQYVVNCTNQDFHDTDILKNLPAETQVLIFTGNYIPEMPWNVFGTLNSLEKLRVVDMSNNKIKEIKGKTYHHVQNVERLILNHNELVISEDGADISYHHPRVLSNFVNLLELHLTNAFEDNTDAALADDLHDIFVNSNLTRLQKLHLEQNEIITFRDHRVFCDLPELRDLYLGDNLLTGINFNVSCLKHLRFLDLEENQLETLTAHELSVFDKINARPGNEEGFMVDFRGNPFACDCSVWDLYSWLKKTNVTVRRRENLRCARPKIYAGNVLVKLKVNPCSLAIPRNVTTKGQKATMGLLVLVTLALFSLVIMMIYTSRFQLRAKLSPMVEAITKKVQYTTIKNRDNVEEI